MSGGSPGEGSGNALQCSYLENPRTEEPDRLQSIGSQRVRHDYSDLAMFERERDTKRKMKIDNVEKNGEENKKMLWLKFKNSLNLNMLVLRPGYYSVFPEEKKKNLQDH